MPYIKQFIPDCDFELWFFYFYIWVEFFQNWQLGYNSSDFILHEIKSGQERAFDYIFRKHYKGLCAQAMLYLKDLDTAQGLVQNCFIKFWEKRNEISDIQNISGYLSFMVRNQCIDYLRKEKVIAKAHTEHESGKTQSENSTENQIILHEFEEELVIALSNLPDRCRMAFEYSRFEELTYPEIAKKMNISVKAVEALLSRALKSLRKELKEYFPLLLMLLNAL